MNKEVLEKSVENVKKPKDIKLVTTERRRNYLVPEPNYRTIINGNEKSADTYE